MREPFADNLVQAGGLFAASAARRQAETIVAAQASADPWTRLHAAASSGEIRDPAESLRQRRARALSELAEMDADLIDFETKIATMRGVNHGLAALAQTINEMP